MIKKVKELRQIVPIPMSEAINLLNDNAGDVQRCVDKFKIKSITEISEITGGDINVIRELYEDEKYDFNRTISAVNNHIFDSNYKLIEGLTAEKIRQVIQWINFGEDKDFAASLDYKYLDLVLHTLSLIPALVNYGAVTLKAKQAHNSIFEDYTDEMPLAEFVRRHKKLDDNPDFQEAHGMFLLSKIVFKDELLKHLRNIEKKKKD